MRLTGAYSKTQRARSSLATMGGNSDIGVM